MSITYKGARNGGYDEDREGNISTDRTLIYHFNAGESAVTVRKQTQIPTRGTAHPDDPTIILTAIKVSQPMEGDEIKSGKYEVALTYSRTNITLVRDATVAPWKQLPYDIGIQPLEQTVAFQKAYQTGDAAGSPSKPVLNPAGDPYEDTANEQNTVLRFSYNLEKFSSKWIDQYSDSVNELPIIVCDQTVPAKKGRIKNLNASKQLQYDSEGDLQYEYWRIDVEIELSKKIWQREIMARGLYALKTASTIASKYRIWQTWKADTGVGSFGTQAEMEAIDADNAQPAEEPQKLNADGTLYASLTGAIYQIFQDKVYANWKTLSLPSTARN